MATKVHTQCCSHHHQYHQLGWWLEATQSLRVWIMDDPAAQLQPASFI
jgi:hypothetical protein